MRGKVNLYLQNKINANQKMQLSSHCIDRIKTLLIILCLVMQNYIWSPEYDMENKSFCLIANLGDRNTS